MFSDEQRSVVTGTFIRYNHSYADTVAERGYPSRATPGLWWREYESTGEIPKGKGTRQSKYTADQIRDTVEAWRGRAWRSRVPEFVEPRRKVKRHMDAIVATATFGLTNARVEAADNKIKLIVKMAYGFRNLDNLFSMVMLKCSDLRVELPGRAT